MAGLRYAQGLVDGLYQEIVTEPRSPLMEEGDGYALPFSGYMTCVREGQNYVVSAEGDVYGDDASIHLKRFDLVEGLWFLTNENHTRCLIGKSVDHKLVRQMLYDMMYPLEV